MKCVMSSMCSYEVYDVQYVFIGSVWCTVYVHMMCLMFIMCSYEVFDVQYVFIWSVWCPVCVHMQCLMSSMCSYEVFDVQYVFIWSAWCPACFHMECLMSSMCSYEVFNVQYVFIWSVWINHFRTSSFSEVQIVQTWMITAGRCKGPLKHMTHSYLDSVVPSSSTCSLVSLLHCHNVDLKEHEVQLKYSSCDAKVCLALSPSPPTSCVAPI